MIFGINGGLRQGKGILATKLALAIADSGGEVLSNYWMDSPNVKHIEFYDLIELLKAGRQEPTKLIVLDEIYGWLESRVASSKVNRFASYFLFHSAKLGYDLIYTAQLNMSVDCRLRELSTLRVLAQKDTENKRFLYHALDNRYTDDDVPTGKVFSLSWDEASKFWKRYDTYEAITPAGMNALVSEVQREDPQRKNQMVDHQVSTLRNLIEKGELPQDTRLIAVKSALLQSGFSVELADLVSYRLTLPQNKTEDSTPKTQDPTIDLGFVPVEKKEGWSRLRAKGF